MKNLYPVSLLALALAGGNSAAQAQDLAFVACPIVKDTPSVPCWLTEYEGELYYMGVQSDVSAPFNPPWLGHMALVEGTPSASGERICGGIVLDPVRVAVMPELSPECDQRLVAEPGYVLPFEPRRPPGPSTGRLAFSPPPPPPPPEPPFEARTFPVYFPFEGAVNFQTPGALGEILDYARAVGAQRIEVTGYRAAVRLTDGTVVEERSGLAELRAGQVARMFDGLVDSVDEIDVVFDEDAEPGDWQDRRVDVRIIP
ncbi:hypothetical protein [Aurantiacibacter gilvus]|uniref:SPOR domain-containing protein n=1 Tax=Aurantiacibacter gilvus TaxID=3139141 RepID=A0ABU9IHZ2_9SPHN